MSQILIFLQIILLTVLMPSPAFAERDKIFVGGVNALDAAKHYYAEEDYAKAIWLTEIAAKQTSSAEAAARLAWHFEQGLGVKVDGRAAVHWYEVAIKRGDQESYNNLAGIFDDGRLVLQNSKRAMALYMKGAELGNANAMLNIGRKYFEGRGVEPNAEKAEQYFRDAINAGSLKAKVNLAMFYLTEIPGSSISVDFEQAVSLITEASDEGLSDATNMLAGIYMAGIVAPQDLKKSKLLFTKTARDNHPDGVFGLGHLYANGLGVKTDLKRGYILMATAQQLGSQAKMDQLPDIAKQLKDDDLNDALRTIKVCVTTKLQKCKCGFSSCF